MMTKLFLLVLIGVCAAPAIAGDIGVSINIGEPGFYGRIEIGNFPPPQLIYAQPMVIQRAPEFASAPPIYLHVPPGHEKHWSKHCAQYNACGRPVYFVRDDWYNKEYVPRYPHGIHGQGEGQNSRHGHGEGHDKDHGHDEGHDH